MTNITLVGNVTRDPSLAEVKGKDGPTDVCNFTVAGNLNKDQTMFADVAVWGDMATNVHDSIAKGTRVIVSGTLGTKSYKTKEGEKRTAFTIRADAVGLELRFAPALVGGAGETLQAVDGDDEFDF